MGGKYTIDVELKRMGRSDGEELVKLYRSSVNCNETGEGSS